MSLVSGPAAPYIGTDQILADQIVYELKSQGIFDSFRKECIADVDTKPAYQNLRQRVEGSVSSFLKEQKWKPESNKNQLRETLRKNIYESGFLETGVERIVSQVVNPKINTVFLPKVKEIFYKYIGLQSPAVIDENSCNIASIPKAEVTIETDVEVKLESKIEIDISTENLLPTDLEAVSPEIDNIFVADNNEPNHDSNFMAMDDDDTSPPFEPIDEDLSFKLIPLDENSIDSHLSGMSGLVSHDSQHSTKDNTVVMQQLLESDSQISKNSSSDDRLSIVTDDASNTKVDMLVVNDGVVVVLESTPSSKDNENSTDNKIALMDVVSEVSQDTKSKDAIDKEKITIDHLVESFKPKVETSEFKIKDEIFDEDSKTVPSSELSDSAPKQSMVDIVSKHSTCKKSTKDYKIDSSKHNNNSKSKDKSRDSNECRENKEKSSNTKVSRSIKDNKSKSSSSTSSNRHSSDNDKDRSANTKKYSSSSSKDKEKSNSSSTLKNKSGTTNSNDKDKSKDRDVSTNTNKEKESSTSSKYRESSSRDYSSSKSNTSSSRDKSSSKDHSKDSKSRNSSSSSKHRSSSSRKYSSSSTTRNVDAKSHASSGSSKDRRDKRDSNIKDDHFSSKSLPTDRRSTDRDSNDGQARNKGSSTSNDSTLLAKIEEQTSNNNTTEDSSSSNSKDGSNSDCCQNGEGNKVLSDEIYVRNDNLIEVTDNLQISQNGEDTKKLADKLVVGNEKMIEVVDNPQPIVPVTIMTDSEIKLECKLDNILEDLEEKDNATLSLVTSLTQKTIPILVESITPDVVETLDAIKSHLVEYKSQGHNDNILLKIKLPKVASNFREARKIMKLRKQLKQHNKLAKRITKENNSDNENAEPLSIGKVINGESHDDIENNVTIKETTSDFTENSLLLIEKELHNDGTVINTSEKMKIDNIVKKETTKTKYNDDCSYLDQVTDKTKRYLNYTASFIDSLDKEIQVLVNKMTVPVTKRKFSTVSSESSVPNDNIGDQDLCSKVTCSTFLPLSVQASTENIPIAVAKRKGQKRKFSTRSSESSIYNDTTADQNSSSSKVSRNTSPALASKTTQKNITVVRKHDTVPSPSGEDSEGVTSATAHVQVVKQRRLYNSKATQRYTSDDLYKPRPFLKGTTKRTSGRVVN